MNLCAFAVVGIVAFNTILAALCTLANWRRPAAAPSGDVVDTASSLTQGNGK